MVCTPLPKVPSGGPSGARITIAFEVFVELCWEIRCSDRQAQSQDGNKVAGPVLVYQHKPSRR